MAPAFRAGDHLWVVPATVEQLTPGDIVQIDRGDHTVSHRLLTVVNEGGETSLVTKGDRSLVIDDLCPAASLSGRVAAIDRDRKILVIGDQPWVRLTARIALWEAQSMSRFRHRLFHRLIHRASGTIAGLLMKLAWRIAGSTTGTGPLDSGLIR
jgi:hypothetical protein